ncbi:MAG: heparinase II/III family protein [Bacteroidia bacterium]
MRTHSQGFRLLLLLPLLATWLSFPSTGIRAQGSWIPANADLSYPRTLIKLSELPALRQWIGSNSENFSLYQGLYADAWGSNPPQTLVSNGDRRVAAHAAKNCAYVLLLNRKPVPPLTLDTLTTTEANTLRNKAINLLQRMNTDVEVYPDFGNYLWRANELMDNLIAYDLLKGAGVADSTLDSARTLLHEYLTSFHTQVAFNTFGLGLTSLHVDNHTLRAVAALGMGAVVLNNATSSSVDGQPQKWIQTALWNIDNVLWRSGVRQSEPGQIGGYAEGPHYLRFGMRHSLEFFHALHNFIPDTTLSVSFDGHNASIRHPWHDPNFENLWEWVMRIRMPDGRDPQVEDCFAQTFNADMALTEQSRFRPTYHGSRFNPAAPTSLWDQLHHSSDDVVADFLSAMTAPTTDSFDLFQTLPLSGDVIMRSGWDTTSTYMHLCVKSGLARSSANGHNHVDVTSFNLHARGQELAIDPGYLKWERRDEVDGPTHHNMILIDGQGPTEASTGNAGDANATILSTFDFQRLDFTSIQTNYRSTDIIRRPMFVRRDYFLLSDKVGSAQPHDYRWQLHALGLEGGDSTHGTFSMDSPNQSGLWSKNGVYLQATVTATGGLSALVTDSARHELRYDSAETHTVLHADKSGQAQTYFLAALVPFEADSPNVELLCGASCDAMAIRRGGFVDIASLRSTVTAAQSGLAADLYGNAGAYFYSENAQGQLDQMVLQDGNLLMLGSDTICWSSNSSEYALARMDSVTYEAFAGEPTTVYFYHLGFVPASVLGWNVVQSWSYDANLDRLEVIVGGQGRFTIHKDFIIGSVNPNAANLLAWPNPFENALSVNCLVGEGTVQIQSVDGKDAWGMHFSNGPQVALDFSGHPAGAYLISFTDAFGQMLGTTKVIHAGH